MATRMSSKSVELSPRFFENGNLDWLASKVNNTFLQDLEADPEQEQQAPNKRRREVRSGHYVLVKPTPLPEPSLVSYSKNMARSLGLCDEECTSERFARFFSGDIDVVPGFVSWATPYALSIYGQVLSGDAHFISTQAAKDLSGARHFRRCTKTAPSRTATATATVGPSRTGRCAMRDTRPPHGTPAENGRVVTHLFHPRGPRRGRAAPRHRPTPRPPTAAAGAGGRRGAVGIQPQGGRDDALLPGRGRPGGAALQRARVPRLRGHAPPRRVHLPRPVPGPPSPAAAPSFIRPASAPLHPHTGVIARKKNPPARATTCARCGTRAPAMLQPPARIAALKYPRHRTDTPGIRIRNTPGASIREEPAEKEAERSSTRRRPLGRAAHAAALRPCRPGSRGRERPLEARRGPDGVPSPGAARSPDPRPTRGRGARDPPGRAVLGLLCLFEGY